MDAETKVAIGAAVVALVAMLVAIWQASEARRARKASERQVALTETALQFAEEQAEAAKKSATSAWLGVEAAEKSANAAEASVTEARKANNLAQEQIDQSVRDRDRADAPDIELKALSRKNGVHGVRATLKKTPGPIRATVSWVGQSASPEADQVVYGSDGDVVGGLQVGSPGPYRLVQDGQFEFGVVVPSPGHSIDVEVHIWAEEISGSRRAWSVTRFVRLSRPPQIRVARIS